MWPSAAQFCPQCGTPLARGQVEGRERSHCSACSFVLYLNPASAAAGLVLDGSGRLLLVRRGIMPFRGDWALPAGYQEVDENPRATVVREVAEETGMRIAVIRLLDLIFVPGDARKPANVALFLCRPEDDRLVPGSDALDAAWFSIDALPDNLGFDNRRLLHERLDLAALSRDSGLRA